MKKHSVLSDKTLQFSIEVIHLCRYLKKMKIEYAIYNQLFRSGLSIGALVREAEFAQSRADFIHKLSIALKEANEAAYWIELLDKGEIIEKSSILKTCADLNEIIRLLASSVKTAKGNSPP